MLGESTEADTLDLAPLRKYVLDRVAEGVESATAKKETVTLRTCWNWGIRAKLLVKSSLPLGNKMGMLVTVVRSAGILVAFGKWKEAALALHGGEHCAAASAVPSWCQGLRSGAVRSDGPQASQPRAARASSDQLPAPRLTRNNKPPAIAKFFMNIMACI